MKITEFFLSLIESANRRVQINMQIHKHVFCFCTTAHNCSNYFSAPRFSTVFSQCKIFLFFQKTLSNYQWKWSCSLCLDFTNRECFMINLIYKWYLIFVSRAGRYLLMFDMNSPPSPPPAFSFSLTFPPSLLPSISFPAWGSLIVQHSLSKPVWSMGWWRPMTLPISFLYNNDSTLEGNLCPDANSGHSCCRWGCNCRELLLQQRSN